MLIEIIERETMTKNIALTMKLHSPAECGQVVEKLHKEVSATKFETTREGFETVVKTWIEPSQIQTAANAIKGVKFTFESFAPAAVTLVQPSAGRKQLRRPKGSRRRYAGGLRVRDWVLLILAVNNGRADTPKLMKELVALGYKRNSLSPCKVYLCNDGYITNRQENGTYVSEITAAGMLFLKSVIGDQSPTEAMEARKAAM